MYPEKFIRDNVVTPFVPTSIVIVILPHLSSLLSVYYAIKGIMNTYKQDNIKE